MTDLVDDIDKEFGFCPRCVAKIRRREKPIMNTSEGVRISGDKCCDMRYSLRAFQSLTNMSSEK